MTYEILVNDTNQYTIRPEREGEPAENVIYQKLPSLPAAFLRVTDHAEKKRLPSYSVVVSPYDRWKLDAPEDTDVECPSCWCCEGEVEECELCGGDGSIDAAKAEQWLNDQIGD